MKTSILLSLLSILLTSARGEQQNLKRHKAGVNVSVSKGNYPHKYIYDTRMYQIQWNYTFFDYRGFEIESILSPQISTTRYNKAFGMTEFMNGYELGFTMGINLRYSFWHERLFVSAMGIIGPMYTPRMPARQGTPINFSDNLAVAVGCKIAKMIMIDLRLGYRHLSNAGINPPNYGINSHWISGGVYYCF